MGQSRKYTVEFKEDALQRVANGETVKAVARNLGISRGSIQRWQSAERKAQEGSNLDQKRHELDDLRQQLHRAEKDLDSTRQQLNQAGKDLEDMRQVRDDLEKELNNLLDTIIIISRRR